MAPLQKRLSSTDRTTISLVAKIQEVMLGCLMDPRGTQVSAELSLLGMAAFVDTTTIQKKTRNSLTGLRNTIGVVES